MVTVLREFPGAHRSDDRRVTHVETRLTPVDPPTEHNNGTRAESPQRSPGRDLTVRSAGLRDILQLRSVDVTFRLNQPEAMLYPRFSPMKTVRSLTATRERKPTTLIAESHGEVLGLAEFQPSMPDLRWQLCSLGLQHASTDPLSIWEPLLDEGTRQAGAAGVKRLYARAVAGSAAAVALQRAGYSTFARERIYSSSHPAAVTSGVSIREQERTDTWAVHQLYNSSVPREVLYAEAYTSHRWELSEGRSTTYGSVRAWIHDRNETPIVYARSEAARRKRVLDVIFSPGNVAVAAQMIDSLILSGTHDSSAGETYLAVRTYNSELEQFLIDRRFQLFMEQDLFVRYTTAPLRVVTSEAVLQEADAHERAPKGVPAYYVSVQAAEASSRSAQGTSGRSNG